MARLELATRLGRLEVVGWQLEVMHAAADFALAEAQRAGPNCARLDFEGRACWWKRGVISGKSRLRWGLKRVLLRARLPRVREYYNLCWLTERLFAAPLPLAAGALTIGGFPRFQFLLTEHVPDAPTLDSTLADRAHPERAAILDALASEIARMHALGFVHHDLYPRNVLIAPRASLQRIVFLDTWAGGPGPNLRDDAYDLACLLLRAEEMLNASEMDAFFKSYARERAAQGRPLDGSDRLDGRDVTREPNAFRQRISRARRALARRLEQRPSERRGLDAPRLTW